MTRTLFACLLALSLLLAAEAAAQTQQTSRGTFAKLMDVQKLMEAERYPEAVSQLQVLAEKNRGNHYDHAVTLQYLAHSAMMADRSELVRPALEEAVNLPGLPVQLVADLKRYYGQVVLGDEEFEFAQQLLEEWYTSTGDPVSAAELFSLAYANYRAGDLARAEVLLPIAIGRQTRVEDSWYRVYYQVLFEQKKYGKAEGILYTLATNSPEDVNVWRLLANHYLQIEDSRRAASAMAVAHNQGLFDTPTDQRRLTSMYAYVQAPEKAARLLERQVEQGAIAADAETLRRLADLWLLARHRATGLDYLQRAVDAAPEAGTYELLGSLFFEDARWNEARDAFAGALSTGDHEEPARIQLLVGVSAAYAGDTVAAREALELARQSPAVRSQADAMLRRLDVR